MKKMMLAGFVWIILSFLPGCVFDGAIIVNPQEDLQAMDGFGASGAWWAQHVGIWEDEPRNLVAKLLFDQTEGIGMSVYRYNIGAGGPSAGIWDIWRTAETFEVSKGVYDWSRDAGGVWFLKQAQAHGVENILAFVNSPPGRMTVSGLTTGKNLPVEEGKVDPGAQSLIQDMLMTALTPNSIWRSPWSNLRPDMVEDFSSYLVDVLDHLRDDEGIPVNWISPINEPQWAWRGGQEGCHYTPDECVVVMRSLMQAINRAGLPVKVSGIDAGAWFAADMYLNTLMADPEIASGFDCFAVHSYGPKITTATKEPLACLVKTSYPKVKLWQTEWCEMAGGRDYGMDSALTMADLVHEDLTLGNVASWQLWIAVSKYDFHDGIIYVDENTHAVSETKRLWALGNYSRFVRPGFVRIPALVTVSGLKPTAFRSADGQRIVLVAINDGTEPLDIRLPELAGYTKIEAYETSDSHDLDLVLSSAAPEKYTFPGRSVTTLVFEKG
jgi:O-glycosyl hydrolase